MFEFELDTATMPLFSQVNLPIKKTFHGIVFSKIFCSKTQYNAVSKNYTKAQVEILVGQWGIIKRSAGRMDFKKGKISRDGDLFNVKIEMCLRA